MMSATGYLLSFPHSPHEHFLMGKGIGQGEQWDFPGHAKQAQPQNSNKDILKTWWFGSKFCQWQVEKSYCYWL